MLHQLYEVHGVLLCKWKMYVRCPYGLQISVLRGELEQGPHDAHLSIHHGRRDVLAHGAPLYGHLNVYHRDALHDDHFQTQ